MADFVRIPANPQIVKSLHDRVQQMAESRIDEAKQEFKELNGELLKKLDDADKTIVQLNDSQKYLGVQVERLTNELKQNIQSLEDTRIKLTKAELQRDEAIIRTTELKENIAELKQENRDNRDHFEYYQHRTAEDRKQEREQFRATNFQMQDQIQELRDKLSQADLRILELTETNQRHQHHTDKLEQVNTKLRSEFSQRMMTVEKLDNEIELALAESRKHQNQKIKLTEQLAEIERQKTETDKDVALLSHSLETTKTTLKAAQDKIMLLTDENKAILHEKAILLGQFKQLQSSI